MSPWLRPPVSAVAAVTRSSHRTTLRRNYLQSLEKGFLKVASKMGISTAMGYRGAQIFETLGLSKDLVDHYFTGTPARLCGIGLPEIEADIRRRHGEAFADPAPKLADLGFVRYRKDGEPHAFEPPLVKLLQEAVNTGSGEAYRAYRDHVAQHAPTSVRDLMRVMPLGEPVPLDDVEPVESIVKRFVVTAMSLGSLSPEAHRTLSIAMNRLGARSNSGEGGEDQTWYDEGGQMSRTPRSSRSPPDGSALPPATSRWPRSWRSRSRKEASRAKVGRSPVTKSLTSSPAFATPCPVCL